MVLPNMLLPVVAVLLAPNKLPLLALEPKPGGEGGLDTVWRQPRSQVIERIVACRAMSCRRNQTTTKKKLHLPVDAVFVLLFAPKPKPPPLDWLLLLEPKPPKPPKDMLTGRSGSARKVFDG